jgi:hypothetical protein
MPPFGKRDGEMTRLLALVLTVLAALRPGTRQRVLWQADLQVRSLTVSEAKGNLTARVVVAAEVGEALGVRVDLLLPVGVGIVAMGEGCQAGPSPTGISELRARVECTLGNLPARTNRTVIVVTTTPPAGVARGFGAMAMSDTPDPKLANNFLERAIPIP